ncbi:MAG: hypothetical protein RR829_06395, partial [Oscillospiraceae bacterium]
MDKTDAKILLSEIESIILNKPLAGTAVPVSAELRELQDAIAMLSDRINETCEFLRNLSIGNLDAVPPDRHNYLSANLKELHAGLRHLTWQANQVASGDYSQKVSFMGEFSDSFNKMVSQLQERERTLVTQSDALKKSMDLLIAIMDGLSDWIIVADRDSGEILYTNESAKEFFFSFDSQRFICGKSECDL